MDKIKAAHDMECIDSLEMTEMKDILVLREKDFYLIGTTDIFKVIDINWCFIYINDYLCIYLKINIKIN